MFGVEPTRPATDTATSVVPRHLRLDCLASNDLLRSLTPQLRARYVARRLRGTPAI